MFHYLVVTYSEDRTLSKVVEAWNRNVIHLVGWLEI